VGPLALPLLILAWPGGIEPAKTAVAFMLPLLCVMDIFAVAFFRNHISWKHIVPLLAGSVAGIVVGSILFVSRDSAWLSVPDRGIKFCVGTVGLGFVLYQAFSKWILNRMITNPSVPGMLKGSVFGFSGGLVSTLAHASGPILQMYLLPQRLNKMDFAGTTAMYFFILNILKLVPFSLLGRIETANLLLGLYMLPLIPAGVALGYFLVKVMKPEQYTGMIYAVLLLTSIMLIVKTATE